MKSLLLISHEKTLPQAWQDLFPNIEIRLSAPQELSENLGVITILDCSTLAYKECEDALEKLKGTRIFALIMEVQLADYGGLFLRAGVRLLPYPLNELGSREIHEALGQAHEMSPSADDLISYSHITREFSKYSQNPLKLLQAMADALRVSLNADWVAFVRVDSHDDNYNLESLALSHGLGDTKKITVDDVVRPDGYTLHIIRKNMPIVISDTEKFSLDGVPVNPHTLEWGFRAAVGLPLMRDNTVFGVMWIMYRQPRHFPYEDLRYMQVYAAHAALAYSYPLQKQLAEQWQKAAQSIFARLSSAETLEMAFQHITDGIAESLHCDIVTFYPYEQRGHYLMLPYEKGTNYPDALRDGEIVALNSLPYQILHDGQTLVIEDAKKDSRFGKTAFAQREKVASLVALPLFRASQKVGVVFINYRRRRSFSPDEREAIQLLGEQIASSLLNTYWAGEQRRSAAEADTFLAQMEEYRRQLSFMMNYIETEVHLNKQDMLEVLKAIARQAYTIAEADRVTIRVVGDNEISTLAIYPSDEQEYTEEERLIRLDGHSRYILDKNEPVIIPNVVDYDASKYEDIQLNPLASQLWKARIGLPLTSGERCIGVMWISFRDAQDFEHSRLRALQTFATMAYSTHIRKQQLERHAYLEAQKSQRDSLLELTHAAMYQFVKGHDMDNFRGLYGSTIPQVRDYAKLLKQHQDLITKPIWDSKIYNEVTDAIEGLDAALTDLNQMYAELIEKHPAAPELTETAELKIRDWLWDTFHKDPELHLNLESSLSEKHICGMPAYWLREILKILVDNGKRAARITNLSKEKIRLVRMEARHCKNETGDVLEIMVSNHGQAVPEAYQDYLIKRVIPRKLREEYGGHRGIGLFMSGVIAEAYEGRLSYEPDNGETRFVLRLPLKNKAL